MKDAIIDNNKTKKNMPNSCRYKGSIIGYSKLVYRSGDNEYFDFTGFGTLSSFYLKLINGSIGINDAKLNMNEFKNEID